MNTSAYASKRLNPSKTNFARLTMVLLLGCGGAAQAQLVDPGFDINPLVPRLVVDGGANFSFGQWGEDSAVLTGNVGPILVDTPGRMLNMIPTSNTHTQTVQAIDVSSGPIALLIASGTAQFTYSAVFTAFSSGPVGGLSMSFFGSNLTSSGFGPTYTNTLSVDALPSSWELITITQPIPVGTQTLLAEVNYLNSSLLAPDGTLVRAYVDSADLKIFASGTPVPEPSSLALAGLACLLGGWASRRGQPAAAA